MANVQQTKGVLQEKLVLASKSQRRVDILNAVGWPCESIPANIDETRRPDEDAVSYVKRLAQEKAKTVAKGISSGLIVGADTIVLVDEEILGQPRDENDARRMLRLLSDKWHDVLTGVALIRRATDAARNGLFVEYEITRVRFAEISNEEIDWYIATGEPMGKAGAYGIQGRAALFIEEIQGDYFNIVGLPIRLVYELLSRSQDTGDRRQEI